MSYNQDGKYEHFTKKEFTSKNPPDRNTTKGEASPDAPSIDWKEMKGLQKPWEAREDSVEGSSEEEKGESKVDEAEEAD